MAMLQVGCESFREIRENDLCYVDKTSFLEEFLTSVFVKVALITRPRRFGKTLMLSMLNDFFDISQDSRSIFEGLAVSKNKALCDKWMNQYPTVFITLKDIEARENFNQALDQVTTLVRQLAISYTYLLESDKVDESDKRIIQEFKDRKSTLSELQNFLVTICRALYAHWGRPVILLIDEYDVPLAKAHKYGCYPDMVQFIRRLLSMSLKGNRYLKFGILTGCLRISGEGFFKRLNNFSCFGISDFDYDDKFGFTLKEVDDLLATAGCPAKKGEIKEWYDGYRFGDNKEIFCPWDILKYLGTLQKNPGAKPAPYWQNSTQNDIVRSFVDRCNVGDVRKKLNTLMAGGCIGTTLIDNLTYDRLYESVENMWTVLYFSGYLTKASPEQIIRSDIKSDGEMTILTIPNKEVLEIFASAISKWFDETVQETDRTELFNAFWSNNVDAVTELLCNQMEDTLSYYDAREDFYHALVLGLFTFTGWEVESNKEYGDGRPDIVLRDAKSKRAAVIEVKRTTSENDLLVDAEKAILQIKTNKYAGPIIRKKGWKVSLWGMAFFKKTCVLRVEQP